MAISSTENVIASVLEQSLVGFWDWSIVSQKKYISPIINQMLGYQAGDIPEDAEQWLYYVMPDDQALIKDAYQKHVSSHGKIPYEINIRYKHKSGSVVHVISRGKVVEWDSMGNPLRMIGYDTDVTKLLRKYENIEERYDQYKTVIEMLNAGIWSYGINTNKEFWSEQFYETLGYAEGEMRPSYFNLLHSLTHPEDNAKLVQAIGKHLHNKEPYKLDLRLKHKDGEYHWYQSAAKTILDEGNTPEQVTGYIIKRQEPEQTPQPQLTIPAEEKPEAVEEKVVVQKSEAAPAPQAVAVNVTLTNPGTWEYDLNRARFGFSKEVLNIFELSEQANLKFEPVNRMFSEQSQEVFQEGFNRAVYKREPYDIQLTLTTHSGIVKTIRETGEPVIDDQGKVVALKGNIELLQQENPVQKEQEVVNAKIADQNKRLLNFAHIASHNLRSHASNLQMILQVLHASQTEEEKKFCLDSLDKISLSLSKTVGNLNELMQIETELNKSKIPISLKEVFDTVIGSLSRQIQESGAFIQADFSKCPIIDYVPAYIESVFHNLISNAIKYKHNERSPYISIRSFYNNGKKVLTVQDNGIGIDLIKNKDRLFRMHQTFHDHPDARGIGLLITKNQVESMGGNISVESEPGKGTTFTIQF